MTFAHLASVLAEVAELGVKFEAAGHRLYLVGGIVRDQWLDQPFDRSGDIDLTTDARPAAIKAIVADHADALWTQGERFGTIGLRSAGRAFEITTHRAESYDADSRKPSVSFGDDVKVDLSRRDFTVNAMAVRVPSGELIDPWGGAADLGAGVLRTPLAPEISFRDDPLRMLRAARFMTRYQLTPTAELTQSATELRERIRIVAIERIGDEVERLLSLEAPGQGLRFLAATGVLAEVLCSGAPELISDVEPRLESAVTIAEHLDRPWQLRLAGLLAGVFHDPGSVRAATQRLRLSRDDARSATRLVDATRSAASIDPHDVPAIRRWALDTTGHRSALALAHAMAGTTGSEAVEAVEIFSAAFAALAATERLDEAALLDGDEVMRVLGIDAGPAVGRAIAHLRDQHINEGPLTIDAQRELLRSWWHLQPPAE